MATVSAPSRPANPGTLSTTLESRFSTRFGQVIASALWNGIDPRDIDHHAVLVDIEPAAASWSLPDRQPATVLDAIRMHDAFESYARRRDFPVMESLVPAVCELISRDYSDAAIDRIVAFAACFGSVQCSPDLEPEDVDAIEALLPGNPILWPISDLVDGSVWQLGPDLAAV